MEKGQGRRIPGTGKGPGPAHSLLGKEHEGREEAILECELSEADRGLLAQVLGCHLWTLRFCSGQRGEGGIAASDSAHGVAREEELNQEFSLPWKFGVNIWRMGTLEKGKSIKINPKDEAGIHCTFPWIHVC